MCVGASVGSTCMRQFFPTTYVLASNSWSQLCRECLNVMSSITSLQSPGWPQTCYVTKDDLTCNTPSLPPGSMYTTRGAGNQT